MIHCEVQVSAVEAGMPFVQEETLQSPFTRMLKGVEGQMLQYVFACQKQSRH